ncbi:MAG: hypothetical protein KDJ69_12140 [Nitratireductor sp.]|nr:hypothetical protein [Nitratireductor sp.]
MRNHNPFHEQDEKARRFELIAVAALTIVAIGSIALGLYLDRQQAAKDADTTYLELRP